MRRDPEAAESRGSTGEKIVALVHSPIGDRTELAAVISLMSGNIPVAVSETCAGAQCCNTTFSHICRHQCDAAEKKPVLQAQACRNAILRNVVFSEGNQQAILKWWDDACKRILCTISLITCGLSTTFRSSIASSAHDVAQMPGRAKQHDRNSEGFGRALPPVEEVKSEKVGISTISRSPSSSGACVLLRGSTETMPMRAIVKAGGYSVSLYVRHQGP
jgi:hypothetical protein